MHTSLKTELQYIRMELLKLERAYETNDENAMFLALAGIKQSAKYAGICLKRKVDRRLKNETR